MSEARAGTSPSAAAPSTDAAAIDVQHLRKVYGDLTAVDDLSFTVAPGEVFGLLGPNGAGKSTTVGCLCGLVQPTGGHVRVAGHDVVQEGPRARAALGVVPQELALYEDLTARENLSFWGAAYGLRGQALRERVEAVLERIGLADRGRERVERFSGGMQRRLNVGCGLVHQPAVLLLDEPTAGVDPQSRVRLLDLVREEAARGTCVLYTTHYMEEAEELCDRLVIVDHGRLLAQGTLSELRELVGERDLLRLSGRFPAAVADACTALDGVEVVSATEDALALAVPGASRRLPELLAAVDAGGGEVRETTLSQASLESLFIHLTGSELRE